MWLGRTASSGCLRNKLPYNQLRITKSCVRNSIQKIKLKISGLHWQKTGKLFTNVKQEHSMQITETSRISFSLISVKPETTWTSFEQVLPYESVQHCTYSLRKQMTIRVETSSVANCRLLSQTIQPVQFFLRVEVANWMGSACVIFQFYFEPLFLASSFARKKSFTGKLILAINAIHISLSEAFFPIWSPDVSKFRLRGKYTWKLCFSYVLTLFLYYHVKVSRNPSKPS